MRSLPGTRRRRRGPDNAQEKEEGPGNTTNSGVGLLLYARGTSVTPDAFVVQGGGIMRTQEAGRGHEFAALGGTAVVDSLRQAAHEYY